MLKYGPHKIRIIKKLYHHNFGDPCAFYFLIIQNKDQDGLIWTFEPNIVVGHPSYNLHGSLHQALGPMMRIQFGPRQPTTRNNDC